MIHKSLVTIGWVTVAWGTWKVEQLPSTLSETYGCSVQGQDVLQHNTGKGSQQNAGPSEMLACFGRKGVSRRPPICPHGQGVKQYTVLFLSTLMD